MTAADAYSLLNSGGLLAGLILVLFGGWKANPWWVFGREFRRVEQERDHWRDIAWKGVNVTEKAVDAAAGGPNA
jgi:hypothetical protein